MSAADLHGVIGDAELAQIQRDMEQRRAELKAALGRRYLCHPDNQVRRTDCPQSILTPAALERRQMTWHATIQQ